MKKQNVNKGLFQWANEESVKTDFSFDYETLEDFLKNLKSYPSPKEPVLCVSPLMGRYLNAAASNNEEEMSVIRNEMSVLGAKYRITDSKKTGIPLDIIVMLDRSFTRNSWSVNISWELYFEADYSYGDSYTAVTLSYDKFWKLSKSLSDGHYYNETIWEKEITENDVFNMILNGYKNE